MAEESDSSEINVTYRTLLRQVHRELPPSQTPDPLILVPTKKPFKLSSKQKVSKKVGEKKERRISTSSHASSKDQYHSSSFISVSSTDAESDVSYSQLMKLPTQSNFSLQGVKRKKSKDEVTKQLPIKFSREHGQRYPSDKDSIHSSSEETLISNSKKSKKSDTRSSSEESTFMSEDESVFLKPSSSKNDKLQLEYINPFNPMAVKKQLSFSSTKTSNSDALSDAKTHQANTSRNGEYTSKHSKVLLNVSRSNQEDTYGSCSPKIQNVRASKQTYEENPKINNTPLHISKSCDANTFGNYSEDFSASKHTSKQNLKNSNASGTASKHRANTSANISKTGRSKACFIELKGYNQQHSASHSITPKNTNTPSSSVRNNSESDRQKGSVPQNKKSLISSTVLSNSPRISPAGNIGKDRTEKSKTRLSSIEVYETPSKLLERPIPKKTLEHYFSKSMTGSAGSKLKYKNWSIVSDPVFSGSKGKRKSLKIMSSATGHVDSVSSSKDAEISGRRTLESSPINMSSRKMSKVMREDFFDMSSIHPIQASSKTTSSKTPPSRTGYSKRKSVFPLKGISVDTDEWETQEIATTNEVLTMTDVSVGSKARTQVVSEREILEEESEDESDAALIEDELRKGNKSLTISGKVRATDVPDTSKVQARDTSDTSTVGAPDVPGTIKGRTQYVSARNLEESGTESDESGVFAADELLENDILARSVSDEDASSAENEYENESEEVLESDVGGDLETERATEQRDATKKPRKLIPPRISTKLTKDAFELFTGMKMTRSASDYLMKGTDVFWENLTDTLTAHAKHAGRKEIVNGDVELVFRRLKFVEDRQSLNAMISRHLPLELRTKILPIAQAKNSTFDV